MDMSNFRTDQLHVALQSRRDKLRYQQNAMGQGGLEVYTDNMDQLSSHHEGLDPDFMQLRSCRYGNVSYEPSPFSTNQLDKAIPHGDSSFAISSQATLSSFNFPSKVSGDPQNCDWVGNYASGSVSITGNTNQMMGRDGFPSDMKIINSSPSMANVKPSYFGYMEAPSSSFTNPSSEISSHNILKHNEIINFSSPFYHQNTLQDVVTSATIGNQEAKMVSFAQQDLVKETGRIAWMNFSPDSANRPADGCHQRGGGSNWNFGRDMRASSSAQALSLSLSSVPASALRMSHEAERDMSKHLQSSSGSMANTTPDSKLSFPKSPVVGGSNSGHRNVGPLGPFTGYATILRSSKFLRPAQQLLDEFCNVRNPKNGGSSEASAEVLSDVRVSSDAVKADEPVVRAAGGGSGDSSSTFYSSNEKHHQEGGALNSSPSELFQPEYIQRKAKLLYMQEEVCRRYKQYHQQMQMVVSSFESVAGLSGATPFISLSLKTISRHFRCLKNAIVCQLKNIGRTLGEELSCPISRSSNSKGDASTSRLKFVSQAFQKQRDVGGSGRSLEPQQHVWRPQRGLPERAVAVLRTWLFDHFLHPYPTDADKHMLATQTGLTRNQVSNWFINARVRVWKPMVEEIHMLEAKGLVESGSSARRTDDDKRSSGSLQGANDSQQLSKLSSAHVPGSQINCSDIGSSASTQDRSHPDMWNLHKRSAVGSHHPERMDESLMDFMPYPRSRIEIGGLGAVSLTLGLRQSAEGAQQPERQFMQHFGDQVMHDFVG